MEGLEEAVAGFFQGVMIAVNEKAATSPYHTTAEGKLEVASSTAAAALMRTFMGNSDDTVFEMTAQLMRQNGQFQSAVAQKKAAAAKGPSA